MSDRAALVVLVLLLLVDAVIFGWIFSQPGFNYCMKRGEMIDDQQAPTYECLDRREGTMFEWMEAMIFEGG